MKRWEVRLQPDDLEPVQVVVAEELLVDDERRAAIFFTSAEVVAVVVFQPGMTITLS